MSGSVIAAVVLAAGAGTRFGGSKQALLLPQVLARVARARLDDTVVVLGAHDVAVEGARTVVAPDWELGPGASLRAGLGGLAPEVDAAVVCLADGPLLSPEAIRRVADTWQAGGDDVVAASYGGVRGHPVCVGRPVWGDIPDAGGRALPAALVPCDDLGAPDDVDTPEDLRRLGPLLDA